MGPATSAATSYISAKNSPAGKRLTALLYVEFVLTGIVTTLLGPMLPSLAHRFSISQADAGTFFVAQFSGSAVGAIFSNLRLRRSLIVGLALISTGVGTAAYGNLATSHLSVFIYGIGLGLVIPATNMLVAQSSSEGRGARLNLLNFAWGAGATASPILIAAGLRWSGLANVLSFIAVCSAITWMLILLSTPPTSEPADLQENNKDEDTRVLLPFLLLCAMLFLYVGIENAVGGWIAALMAQLGRITEAASALSVFFFWGALLLGRAVAPAILKRYSEAAVHRAGLILAAAGAAILMLAQTPNMVRAGSVMAGLGLAPVFALTISLLAEQEERSRRRAGGWVFALGGMGGAALPWLSGRVASLRGSIHSGYSVPIMATILFLAILLSFPRVCGWSNVSSTVPRDGRPQ
jgi:fucose permease